jgi:hypothetical protein
MRARSIRPSQWDIYVCVWMIVFDIASHMDSEVREIPIKTRRLQMEALDS